MTSNIESWLFLDRDTFANLVREVASPDVGRMGIEILSFTIKDIYDEVNYLDSLGKTQTAVVKRNADIGVAEAKRDAGIRVSTRFFKSNIAHHHIIIGLYISILFYSNYNCQLEILNHTVIRTAIIKVELKFSHNWSLSVNISYSLKILHKLIFCTYS